MAASVSRRQVLASGAVGAATLGLGDIGFLSRLAPVSAAEAKLDTKTVRFGDNIEPLVRTLEETPRDKLLEEIGGRVRKGLSYREVLAALLLAGVRNIQPRPSVGHKFHSVLVVNSAHIASLASSDEHRWLPIFWALDQFKSGQEQDTKEGNWTMSSVDGANLPQGEKARAAVVEAFDRWDADAVDPAIAGLARTAGPGEVFELLFRYGARDFRSIGHKAIYVANSMRTLESIGWQHAEPVLRSLAYALQAREGDAGGEAAADRPWKRNRELAGKIRGDWAAGKMDSGATKDLLQALRESSDEAFCQKVVETLNAGYSPQVVWDALFVGAGELLARQPGIVALHAVTSTNAFAKAYDASSNDETRRLLLLQNAAFIPLFRGAAQGRGKLRDYKLDEIKPGATDAGGDAKNLDAIFAAVSGDKDKAAEQVLGYLKGGGSAAKLIDAARVLVFVKGNNAHDYKFSSAVLEDYYRVSPAWRDHYLASSVFNLRGSGGRDNPLVERIRSSLKG